MAYDDGLQTVDSNRFASVYIVFQYRSVLYPYTTGSGATLGRMAWTCAGWDAGAYGNIAYPDYVSLPYATPNENKYDGVLMYSAGDAGMGYGISGWAK